MTVTIWLLGAFVVLQLAVGLWIGRRVRGASDFFVAGRRLPALLVFATFLAANIGAGSTVGAASIGYRHRPGRLVVERVSQASAPCFSPSGPARGCGSGRSDRGFLTFGDFLEWRYGRVHARRGQRPHLVCRRCQSSPGSCSAPRRSCRSCSTGRGGLGRRRRLHRARLLRRRGSAQLGLGKSGAAGGQAHRVRPGGGVRAGDWWGAGAALRRRPDVPATFTDLQRPTRALAVHCSCCWCRHSSSRRDWFRRLTAPRVPGPSASASASMRWGCCCLRFVRRCWDGRARAASGPAPCRPGAADAAGRGPATDHRRAHAGRRARGRDQLGRRRACSCLSTSSSQDLYRRFIAPGGHRHAGPARRAAGCGGRRHRRRRHGDCDPDGRRRAENFLRRRHGDVVRAGRRGAGDQRVAASPKRLAAMAAGLVGVGRWSAFGSPASSALASRRPRGASSPAPLGDFCLALALRGRR